MEVIPKLRFYFHPNELYYPCSFEYFVDNSKLYKKINPEKFNEIGKVDQLYLSNLNCNNDRNNFQLIAKDEIKNGFVNDLQKIPLYGFRNTLASKVYITLFLFYAYNGPYNIMFIQDAGEHWGDMERIVLEYDNNILTKVYCGAHGDRDGRWIDIKDIEKEGEHLVFYIAKDGHGFYPKKGIYWRIYGLANDLTEKGKMVENENYVNIPKPENATNEDRKKIGLAYFCGLIGINGISSFMYKSWGYQIPSESSPPVLVSKTSYNLYVLILVLFVFSLLFFLYIFGIYKLNRWKYPYFVVIVILLALIIAGIKNYIKYVSA
jgi:hypothetical protein